jgi:hypothetical protein
MQKESVIHGLWWNARNNTYVGLMPLELITLSWPLKWSRILSMKMREKYQIITIKQVCSLIRKVYPDLNPKYNKLWRRKEIDVSYVYGSWSSSYALLPRLLNAIILSNPWSMALILSDALPQPGVCLFKCAAWAFAPCIEAFCYLWSIIKGRLLLIKSSLCHISAYKWCLTA